MEWKIPNDPDTKFRLGSVTKQFTATLIMQLVEQGKIRLDGKLTDYLTDYRKDTGDKITIHHLLCHTSGVPNYTADPGYGAIMREPFKVADFVKNHTSGDLEFEPGTKFNYSNSGYFLLGAVIEKVTGKPYVQVLKENIFDPIGMKNSGYDTHAPIISNRATGYSKTADGYVNADYLDMSIPFAAGSLYSTVGDLYLWDQALYGDKILSAKSKEKMFTPNLDNYGYGWGISKVTLSDKKTVIPTIAHNGGINGFSTLILRAVGDKDLIVLLDNTEQGRFQGPISMAIANILYGQSYATAKRSISETLFPTIKEKGIDAGLKQYRNLKSGGTAAEYDFSEVELNTLGYRLLQGGSTKDAIEVFKLNVEMFPASSNPYDSLGEAFAVAGEKELAIKNYKRAIEIDPKAAGSIAALKRLESPAITVNANVLASYAGDYQLAPGFVLTITSESGKLFGQATGQSKFELEPVSETRFEVKIVKAEVEFTKDDKGAVTGLILHQGGRDLPGQRLP